MVSEKKEETKRCKNCDKEISARAKKCPFCQTDLRNVFRRHPILTFLGILFLLLMVLSGMPSTNKKIQESSTTKPTVTSTVKPTNIPTPSVTAKKELEKFMALSQDAGLVISYEFSDKASVVYVGGVWYTQTVAFKKDFLAKVGMLKKEVTGYTNFVIRDAYSNEKVAEITAFTQSLEVYK